MRTNLLLCIFRGLIFFALAALDHPSGHAAETTSKSSKCDAPGDLTETDLRLPSLGSAIAARHAITIVAIGGASTAGTAAGSPNKTYPFQLEETLRRRFPDIALSVINHGIARQTTSEMVARFERDVIAAKPDLVLWETGTNDAVRGIDLDDFSAGLQAGLDRLHDHHLEVIMIDMQFARDTDAVINFQPYLDILHEAADANEVPVFRRFEIMRFWSESGVFDLGTIPKASAAAQAGEVYGCLAERLADLIVLAAK
jgi:lysophospholipase L1-like esterase